MCARRAVPSARGRVALRPSTRRRYTHFSGPTRVKLLQLLATLSLHDEDVRLLREASGSHTDAEVLSLFQKKK